MEPKWAEYVGRTEIGWTRMLDAPAKALSEGSVASTGSERV